MNEEVRNWLSKYLVKKDDPQNKLGKTYIRPLKEGERLPNGVYHKAGTGTSGILHFKHKDYYWYLDNNDKLIIEDSQVRDSMNRFIVESYYDKKGRGLEDRAETNDIEEAKEWIFQKSQDGFVTRIIDRVTGEVWPFEKIIDVEDLETIEPYEEEIEEFKSPDELEENEIDMWFVEWFNRNGVKFRAEFDSKEDAERYMKQEQNDKDHINMTIRENVVSLNDSFNSEKSIKEIKDLIDDCYNYGNYDAWVDEILMKHGLPETSEDIFEDMSEQQIREAFEEIRLELINVINNGIYDFLEDQKRIELAKEFGIEFQVKE